MAATGSAPFKLPAKSDLLKTGKVLLYLASAAALTAIAEALPGMDLSAFGFSIAGLQVTGAQVGMAVSNALIYLVARIATDTRGK